MVCRDEGSASSRPGLFAIRSSGISLVVSLPCPRIFRRSPQPRQAGLPGAVVWSYSGIRPLLDDQARTVEDVLWRRTKKGLRMTEDGKRRLRAWLEGGGGAP